MTGRVQLSEKVGGWIEVGGQVDLGGLLHVPGCNLSRGVRQDDHALLRSARLDEISGIVSCLMGESDDEGSDVTGADDGTELEAPTVVHGARDDCEVAGGVLKDQLGAREDRPVNGEDWGSSVVAR